METALEIATYIMVGTFFVGVAMVVWLMKEVLFPTRFTTTIPPLKKVPTTALEAVRKDLENLKVGYGEAQGEKLKKIDNEIRHLEHRIAVMEEKAIQDQEPYFEKVKRREKVWKEWRDLHNEMLAAPRFRRGVFHPSLRAVRKDYQNLDRRVEHEFQLAGMKDTLALEEYRKAASNTPGILGPPPSVTGTDGAAKNGSAQSAHDTPRPKRHNRWKQPLPPYPLASRGVMSQQAALQTGRPNSELTYLEPEFTLDPLPNHLLTRADFARSSFAEVVFQGTHRYLDCNFAGTDLRRIVMRQAEQVHMFQQCNLQGAQLQQSHLVFIVFNRCDLSNTNWKGAKLDRVRFEQCRMAKVHWEGVDLSRTVMSEDMLGMLDFSQASKPPYNYTPPAPDQEPEPPPGDADGIAAQAGAVTPIENLAAEMPEGLAVSEGDAGTQPPTEPADDAGLAGALPPAPPATGAAQEAPPPAEALHAGEPTAPQPHPGDSPNPAQPAPNDKA